MKRRVAVFMICLLFLSPSCHRKSAEVKNVVVLLTDYGNESFYVGALKGAMLSVNPAVRIIDITHLVPEYDIQEGAYLLLEAAKEYTAGTVFIAIVDPGVGSGRKCIALRTEVGKYYVGPDNGIFTLVIQEEVMGEIREITNQKLFRHGRVSQTFQGRDIFGPVGARLSAGLPLSEVGPELESWVTLPLQTAKLEGRKLGGQVLTIDRYGNVITNIPRRLVEEAGFSPGDNATLEIKGKKLPLPFRATYSEVPEGHALCLINAEERLEMAVNLQGFAQKFGIRPGDQFEIYK